MDAARRRRRRCKPAFAGHEPTPRPRLDPGTRGSKEELQRLVHALGGQVHANETAETNLVVDADEVMGQQVRYMVEDCESKKKEAYDIVTARWLFDCEEHAQRHGQRLPLEPRYGRYATPLTKEKMEASMDPWGDRYAEPASEATLKVASALLRNEQLANPKPDSTPTPGPTPNQISSALLRKEQLAERARRSERPSITHSRSTDVETVNALDDESLVLQHLRQVRCVRHSLLH